MIIIKNEPDNLLSSINNEPDQRVEEERSTRHKGLKLGTLVEYRVSQNCD